MKPALILLPGMLCDHGYYEAQLDELQRVAEVSIASYPTVSSIAEMALQVLAGAPPRFVLAGHSMGGRVAQEIVARAPERVLGLGLFGTDYRGFENEQERQAEQVRRQEWLARIDHEGFAPFAQWWAPRLVAPHRRSDQALVARIAHMAERLGRAGLDAHCLAGLSRPDYGWLLPRIAVPTLLIAGSEDRVRTAATHAEMSDLIPDSRFAIIERAGHMMSMEDPQAVNAAMLPWLAALTH